MMVLYCSAWWVNAFGSTQRHYFGYNGYNAIVQGCIVKDIRSDLASDPSYYDMSVTNEGQLTSASIKVAHAQTRFALKHCLVQTPPGCLHPLCCNEYSTLGSVGHFTGHFYLFICQNPDAECGKTPPWVSWHERPSKLEPNMKGR